MEKFIKKYGVLILLYFTIFCGIVMLNARCRYLNQQSEVAIVMESEFSQN